MKARPNESERPGRIGRVIGCPACALPMLEVTQQGILLDRCNPCGLTWFDAEELEEICGQKQGAVERLSVSSLGPEELGESDRRCPVCEKALTRLGYVAAPLLRMEACRGHGFLVSDDQIHALQKEVVRAAEPCASREASSTALDLGSGVAGGLDALALIGDLVEVFFSW